MILADDPLSGLRSDVAKALGEGDVERARHVVELARREVYMLEQRVAARESRSQKPRSAKHPS